jgi:phosphoribosyl 1,2-cyclic phosphate phosphodiesterase
MLIDAGPDFRTQALRYGVDDVDAVLITHHHFDHVAGLDDLRPLLFRNRAAIPCYAVQNTVETLTDMYPYIFRDGSYPGVARLTLRTVEGPFSVSARSGAPASVHVIPIPAMHGTLPILGFRIGSFAYLTDVSDVPFASRHLLEDLDLLVLDALREQPHPMHLSFSQAIDLASSIGARETWFIHMTHGVLHADVDADLPEGMSLGWDGRVSRSLRSVR